MSRKLGLYRAVTYLGVVVGAFALLAAYTGNAEPLVSASEMPGEPWYAFVGIAALMLFAALFTKYLASRSWASMGRRADFTPEGGGSLLGTPDLTARLDGRQVRARTRTVTRKNASSQEGSKKATYTVVEADLAEPTDANLLLGRAEDGAASEILDLGSGAIQTQTIDDEFLVVGNGSESLAKDLLTPRVRDALDDVEELSQLSVGDPSEPVLDALPDSSGSAIGGMLGGKLAEKLEERLAGSETTVGHQTKGVLLDPDDLSRQAEAVAALADALETTQQPN